MLKMAYLSFWEGNGILGENNKVRSGRMVTGLTILGVSLIPVEVK